MVRMMFPGGLGHLHAADEDLDERRGVAVEPRFTGAMFAVQLRRTSRLQMEIFL